VGCHAILLLKALISVCSLRKNALCSWGANVLKHRYEAGDRGWTGHRAEHTYRLRQTSTGLTPSPQSDKRHKSLLSFVLELREDLVPLLLVLLPNRCLLLTEFHRLTLTGRLCLGFR
jgi:hypothetical protein